MNPHQSFPPSSDEFEISPNMVPGEIEVAQQISRRKDPTSSRSSGKFWVTATMLVMVAGLWGYLRQNELKQALGMQAASAAQNEQSSCEIQRPCCSRKNTEPESVASACSETAQHKHETVRGLAENSEETCCEKGQRSALAAALLQKPEESESGLSVEFALTPVLSETSASPAQSDASAPVLELK